MLFNWNNTDRQGKSMNWNWWEEKVSIGNTTIDIGSFESARDKDENSSLTNTFAFKKHTKNFRFAKVCSHQASCSIAAKETLNETRNLVNQAMKRKNQMSHMETPQAE